MNLLHKKYKEQLFLQLLSELELNSFSNKIIRKANIICGFDEYYHEIIFLKNSNIIKEFELWKDRMAISSINKKPEGIRKKITIALLARIRLLNIEASKRCYGYLLSQGFLGIRCAIQTCDLIWRYAGDESTDFNYYTKRGLLVSVYLSSLAFYCQDSSEQSKDTEIFVQNMLDKIVNISKLKTKFPNMKNIPFLRLL